MLKDSSKRATEGHNGYCRAHHIGVAGTHKPLESRWVRPLLLTELHCSSTLVTAKGIGRFRPIRQWSHDSVALRSPDTQSINVLSQHPP